MSDQTDSTELTVDCLVFSCGTRVDRRPNFCVLRILHSPLVEDLQAGEAIKELDMSKGLLYEQNGADWVGDLRFCHRFCSPGCGDSFDNFSAPFLV